MKRLFSLYERKEGHVISSLEGRHIWMSKRIRILLTGMADRNDLFPDTRGKRSNARFSSAADLSELRMIPDSHALWVLPMQEEFRLAIFRSSLFLFELEDSSRCLPQRWPRAPRREEDFLGNPLYKDRIGSTASPSTLLATIEQFTGAQDDRRLEDAEL